MFARSLATALAAAAIVAFPLTAQRAGPVDTIGLEQAVRLARANNPSIAAREALVRAAGARIAPAGALTDPTLQIGFMNYMLPGLSPRGDPMTMNQITLMQMVPINGMLGLRRSVARSDSARVAFGRDAAVLDVERAARSHYWELYHIDRQLEVMNRTLAVLRDLAGISSTMYAVGGTAQSDVMRAQTAVTRMQQDIVEMELEHVSAAAAFNAALGRAPETPVTVPAGEHARHGMSVVLSAPELPPLDVLMLQADSANPDVAAAQAMNQGAGTGERLARRMIIPDLSVGVSYGQRTGEGDMLSAMIGVSVPIFAGSRQNRMRDEARAMREAAAADLSAVRLDIRAMVTRAYAEAVTARRQVSSYTGTLLPQAEASVTAALAAYRVGRVDFLAVLEAQMALLEYEHDLHRYEAMYGIAVAELDRLTGRSLIAGPAGSEN